MAVKTERGGFTIHLWLFWVVIGTAISSCTLQPFSALTVFVGQQVGHLARNVLLQQVQRFSLWETIGEPLH